MNFNLISKLLTFNTHLGMSKKITNTLHFNNIFGLKKNINIINLNHTLLNIQKIIPVISKIIQKKGNIFIIKYHDPSLPNNIQIYTPTFKQLNQNFFENWIPGTLTNHLILSDKINNTNFSIKQYPNCIILFSSSTLPSHIITEANKLKIPNIVFLNSKNSPKSSFYPILTNLSTIQIQKLYLTLLKKTIITAYLASILNFKYKL